MNALGSVKMQKRIVVKSMMMVKAMGKAKVMKARGMGRDMISMAMDWEKDTVVNPQRIVSAASGHAGARAPKIVEEATSRVNALSGSHHNMEVMHALLFMKNGIAIPTLAVVVVVVMMAVVMMAVMAVVMMADMAVVMMAAMAIANLVHGVPGDRAPSLVVAG